KTTGGFRKTHHRPRRLDVHAHRRGLQSGPAGQAGWGSGVVTLGLCPESAERQQKPSKSTQKPVPVPDSLQLTREFPIGGRQIVLRDDFFRSLSLMFAFKGSDAFFHFRSGG